MPPIPQPTPRRRIRSQRHRERRRVAPPARPAARPLRLWLADRSARRTIGIGLVLTLLFWPVLVWLFTLGMGHLSGSHMAGRLPYVKPKPNFDIEMVDDLTPTPPPPPERFVETNPDAPENTPDKTRNTGAQNQQAAQETPTPDGKSDTPALEGEKDREVTQIVSGRLAPPTPPESAPSPPAEPAAAQAGAPAPSASREQIPLSGDQEITGESETGYGMRKIENTGKPPTPNATEHVKGRPDAPDTPNVAQDAQAQIDPRRPQPRPRVNKNVRPAIFSENKFGTSNIGAIAFDAKWSNYAQYLQRLIDTVQVQWERILDNTRTFPPTGTKVTVKFRLEATRGAVSEIIDTESNGGSQAESQCRSAITDRSPFGAWTEDMVAILGESQELTFTFYYGTP
jgi:hypothetical protein